MLTATDNNAVFDDHWCVDGSHDYVSVEVGVAVGADADWRPLPSCCFFAYAFAFAGKGGIRLCDVSLSMI